MDILDTLNVAGSGLAAQRVRLSAIASNLANAETTRTAEGGPYLRRAPMLVAEPVVPFATGLDRELLAVRVQRMEIDPDVEMVHDPDHPDAGPDGMVAMPAIDVLSEMVDLMTASRAYEANANAVDVTRDMALRALEIGR